MSDLRAAAQQALEVLGSSLYPQPRQVAAIAALKAALAEQAQEQDIEDAIEAAYWHFDARRSGLNEWASAPQSERDAFKAEARKLVRGYFPTRQAQDTKREMLTVADAFIRGKRAALAQAEPEDVLFTECVFVGPAPAPHENWYAALSAMMQDKRIKGLRISAATVDDWNGGKEQQAVQSRAEAMQAMVRGAEVTGMYELTADAALAQAEPVQDLIPPDSLFVCDQMGAHVTRVRVEQQAEPVLCDHCSSPLFAARQCRVCGRKAEQIDEALLGR